MAPSTPAFGRYGRYDNRRGGSYRRGLTRYRPRLILRQYVRYNSVRKGLFGGSRMWLGVWTAGRVRSFAGRVAKRGEAPVVYREPLAGGHWSEVVHAERSPSARAVRRGANLAARADRRARRAELTPTPRRIRLAITSQRRSYRANRSLGPARSIARPPAVDPALLRPLQRRAIRRYAIESLTPLERLAAQRTW